MEQRKFGFNLHRITRRTHNMATPTVADTLPVALGSGLGGSTYTVPSGSNQVLVMLYANGNNVTPTASLNGQSLIIAAVPNRQNNRAFAFYGYLIGPTTGTFSTTGDATADWSIITFNAAAQSSPIDIANASGNGTSVASNVLTLTTNVGNDALFEMTIFGSTGTLSVDVAETKVVNSNTGNQGMNILSWKPAGAVAASETMTTNYTGSAANDHFGVAIKLFTASGPSNIKTWDGITQSTGIKTYNGLALASTKSVNGIT